MSKTALITGITGQDGSYLAELLLEKGYKVHGLIRRSSEHKTARIDHIKDKITLHWGDLQNDNHIASLIDDLKPDEVYNLASQSDVRISFDVPEYTGQITGLGATRLLEAIRKFSPETKFYQASSSEMFGLAPTPQNELSPMIPQSPYAVAKVYAHHMTKIYRKAYGIFACCGILFNHESLPKHSPLIIRDKNGLIDILPIEDLFKSENHRYEGIKDEFVYAEIWDGKYWTRIIKGFCYQDKAKPMRIIQTRKSTYEATLSHIAYESTDNEVETGKWSIGDKVYSTSYPPLNNHLKTDNAEVKFIGYVVGDGHISNNGKIRLTGTNLGELDEIASLVCSKYGWTYRTSDKGISQYPNGKKTIFALDIHNDSEYGLWLKKHIYTNWSKEKRIPTFILNADEETKHSFWTGYYMADGRKAGHERYIYKGFTTKSATLCLGLICLFNSISKATIKAKMEYRDGHRYYYTQITSPTPTRTGRHLIRPKDEIISVRESSSKDGWFYDLETESHCYATGAGLFKLHNSPRRGENFVTRKITKSAVEIYKGERDILYLGNLAGKRDWGYAPNYIEAMWLMMQHSEPDDFVIGTGETHTVQEYLEETFRLLKLDWKKYVKIDPVLFRPTETHCLCADATKAKKVLGWKPTVTFRGLVKLMLEAEIKKEMGE